MPIFLEMFFFSNMNNLYRLSDTSLVLLIIFVFISISIFIYKVKLRVLIIRFFFINLFKNWILKTCSIVFLVLACYFFMNYNAQFRHTGENLTDIGGWIIVLVALRGYFKAFLFYLLIAKFKNINIQINRILLLIISISFTLSMVSSLDIVLISLSLLIFLNKEKLLLNKESRRIPLFQITRNIILSVSLFGAIIFTGVANKVGTQNAKDLLLNNDLIKTVFISTGLRLSTYYASIHGALNVIDKQENNLSRGFFGALQNTLNRGVYLVSGEKLSRPEVWSIYRANYKNLFLYNDNDRTGASPGIIASVFYGPNILFGIIIIFLYIIYTFHILKWAFNYLYKFNIFGYIIALAFVMPFLESPMDLVNFFNTSFIYVYSIIGGILHLKNKSNNHVR